MGVLGMLMSRGLVATPMMFGSRPMRFCRLLVMLGCLDVMSLCHLASSDQNCVALLVDDKSPTRLQNFGCIKDDN